MILLIGDMHFRERLPYADCVADGRESEVQDILDTVVAAGQKCDKIVFMGDCFHTKNNPSSVVRMFVNFVERFRGKELFFLAGNHEKFGDGRSALDFLAEIKETNWKIISRSIESFGDLVFCPYFFAPELKVNTYQELTAELMKKMPAGKMLFIHQALTDSVTTSGQSTNLFEEPVFNRKDLEKRYQLVVGGHIHKPQVKGKTIVTGSLFTEEIGAENKSVWIVDELSLDYEAIPLPARPIYKLENPSESQLAELNKKSIIKVVFTDKDKKEEIDKIRPILEKFDGFVLVEQYSHERSVVPELQNTEITDFSPDKMLGLYAQTKQIDIAKLQHAWQLIQ